MLTFSTYSYPYESSNLLGIDDIIIGIPDNNNNLITPRNLRDAVYTTWVNNIFKQTNSSGVNYIGLDSDNASNILTIPFYFGKRKYLGNNVMTPILLNNGTDIFFYNNKPDSVTQSTIVTFLAGDSTLFNKAPYIITSATNSGLDISVINPNGNINLLSASNSNIYLNGYQFPSSNTASSIGNSLVLSDNNILTWKTVDFSYTNVVGMPASFQAFSKGKTFSNATLTDIITGILYPYVSPSVSLSLTLTYHPTDGSNNYFIEVGSGIGNILNYIPNVKPISLSATVSFSNSNTIGLTTSTISTVSNVPQNSTYAVGGTASFPYLNSGNFSYTITAIDGSSTQSSTKTVTIVYPYFYGMSSVPLSGITASLNSLSKYITTQTTLFELPNNLNGSGQYVYFLVPKEHGLITDILDTSTNYHYLFAYSYISVTISSPDSYWYNHPYYLYYYYSSGYYTTSIPNVKYKISVTSNGL
jgi:hypothetical protein